MNKDHVEGAFSEVKGNVKDAVGQFTVMPRRRRKARSTKCPAVPSRPGAMRRDAIDSVAADAAETLSDAASQARSTLRDTARQ